MGFYEFAKTPTGIILILISVGLLIWLIVEISKPKKKKFNAYKELLDKNEQVDNNIASTTKEINDEYGLNIDGIELKNEISKTFCMKYAPCTGDWEPDPLNPTCCKIKDGKQSFYEEHEAVILLGRDYLVGEVFEKTMKTFVPNMLNKAAGKAVGMSVSDNVVKKVSGELTETISQKVGKEVSEEVVQGMVQKQLGKKISAEVAEKIAKEVGEEISEKIAKEIAAEILEKVIKEVLEEVVETIVRRIALKMALFFVKLAKNMSLGPIGIILEILDVLSLVLDIFDPFGFENYVSQGDYANFRNIILYAFIKKQQESNKPYPMLYPISLDPKYSEDFQSAYEVYAMSSNASTEIVNSLLEPDGILFKKIESGEIENTSDAIMEYINNNEEVGTLIETKTLQSIKSNIPARDKVFEEYFEKKYPGKFKLYSKYSTEEMAGISYSKTEADKFLSASNKDSIDKLIQCFGIDCFFIGNAGLLDRDDKWLSENQKKLKSKAFLDVSPPIFTDTYYDVNISNPGSAKNPNLKELKLDEPAPLFIPMVGFLIDMCEGTTWARSQIGNLVNFIDTSGEMLTDKIGKGVDELTPQQFDDFVQNASIISGANDKYKELNDFREKNQITDDDIDETVRQTLNFQTGPKFNLGRDYGNRFNKDKLLCAYTSKFCRDMGLGPTTPSSGVKSCKMYKGQAVAEMIFGKTLTRIYIISANELADQVKIAAKKTEDAFNDAYGTSKKWVKGAAATTKDFFVDDVYKSGIKVAADATWDWTTQAGEDAWDWTAQAGEDAWDWTAQAGKDAGDWTAQAGKDAWDWTAQAGKDAGDALSSAGKATVSGLSSAASATGGALSSAGKATVSALGSAFSWLSDERLKDNMVLVEYNINGLGINLYQFTWNDIARKLYNKRGKTYGFSANEILKVYPELIKRDKNGYLFIYIPKNTNNPDYQRIYYTLKMLK